MFIAPHRSVRTTRQCEARAWPSVKPCSSHRDNGGQATAAATKSLGQFKTIGGVSLIALAALQDLSTIVWFALTLVREAIMRTLISRFVREENGATAIEYALIAGGISIVIVAAVNSLGTTLNTTFSSVSTALK
jgi:pilus assembly protein Flp/PilA